MLLAKNRYEQRRVVTNGTGKNVEAVLNQLNKQHDEIVHGKINYPFYSDNKHSIEELDRRKFMKLSACLGRNLERVFEINKEEKFAYYTNNKAEKPKKLVDTNQFECIVEQKDYLSGVELKTWTEKDEKKDIRLKISVPKNKKKRDIFFYTDDLFEAEYLKLEIDKNLMRNLRYPIYNANQIFKTSVGSNLSSELRYAPIRRDNWDKISAVLEAFPGQFDEVIKAFGQLLINKAKAKLMPKTKWVYDFKDYSQTIDDGLPAERNIKSGKLIVEDYGMQFINDARQSDKIMIDDYDKLHCIICQKNGSRYDVAFKGRKIKTLAEDLEEVQDPMENM